MEENMSRDSESSFVGLVYQQRNTALASSFLSCSPYCENDCNLVPRVLSLSRESTLVAAGHVSMYTNQIRIGGWIIDLLLSTLPMEVKVPLLLNLES